MAFYFDEIRSCSCLRSECEDTCEFYAKSHKTMTNQEAMARLSPEEFYYKMYWLLYKYGCQFNSTELAVIDWLKQEATE